MSCDDIGTDIAVICEPHFDELKGRFDDILEPVTVAYTQKEAARCFMCATTPNPDAKCYLCGCALHPQWPAVYCSNRCALKDSMDEEKKENLEKAGWKVGSAEEFLSEEPDPNPDAPFEPDWVSPPGDSIADILEHLGKSPNDLAVAMNRTLRFVQGLLRGEEEITAIAASELANALQTLGGGNIGQGARSPRFWLTREQQYRDGVIRLREKMKNAKIELASKTGLEAHLEQVDKIEAAIKEVFEIEHFMITDESRFHDFNDFGKKLSEDQFALLSVRLGVDLDPNNPDDDSIVKVARRIKLKVAQA